MKFLFCDSETYSEQPITDGTYKYVQHPSTEVLVWSYAFDMEPVQFCDRTSDAFPLDFYDALDDPNVMKIAFNVPFDRGVIEHVEGYHSPIEQWADAQILAYALSFAGGLDMVLQQIGFPQDQQKNKEGKQLINRFCSPAPKNHKADRYDKFTHPAEWLRFIDYAIQDTEVLRKLWIWCAQQKPTIDWDDWRMADRTNQAGIPIDKELCITALEMHTQAKAEIKNTLKMATGLENPLSNMQMKGWLAEQGLELENLAKDTLSALDEMPPELALYSKAVSTAPTKYKAFLSKTCDDGTVKGAHQFIGASRTGRDASRGINTQNLKRGPIDDYAPEIILKGDTDIIGALYGDVINVLATSVRAAIAAPEGKVLLISDLAGIEGRALPWLCFFTRKLDQIAGGMDMYKVAACSIYHKQYEDIDKDERFVGKVAELACFAPDTQVLTDSGVKDIVDVLIDDKLWDGMQWATHKGLIYRGEQETINVNGVEVTKNHQILVKSEWKSAQMVVSNASTILQALETGSENLPLSKYYSNQQEGSSVSKSGALVEPRRTTSSLATLSGAKLLDAIGALKDKLLYGVRTIMGTQISSRTPNIGEGCSTEYPPAMEGATTRRMQGITTMVLGGSKCSGRKGQKAGDCTYRTSLISMGGIFHLLNWTGLTLMETMRQVIYGSSPDKKIPKTKGRCPKCKEELTNLRPVYDIAHVGSRNRFTIVSDDGYLIVHNCGYQGAVGAFSSMASAFGLDLPEELVKRIVKEWRKSNYEIVQFWYELERMAIYTIVTGEPTVSGRIRFSLTDLFLVMHLPSGRNLYYYKPEMVVREVHGSMKDQISFMGLNTHTRKWERTFTYGGKLAENATQGLSRDIFYYGYRKAIAAGLDVRLRVHDELVCVGEPDQLPLLISCMEDLPPWAEGLPLKAEGDVTKRYKK